MCNFKDQASGIECNSEEDYVLIEVADRQEIIC